MDEHLEQITEALRQCADPPVTAAPEPPAAPDPDWSTAPEWAQWWARDVDMRLCFDGVITYEEYCRRWPTSAPGGE